MWTRFRQSQRCTIAVWWSVFTLLRSVAGVEIYSHSNANEKVAPSPSNAIQSAKEKFVDPLFDLLNNNAKSEHDVVPSSQLPNSLPNILGSSQLIPDHVTPVIGQNQSNNQITTKSPNQTTAFDPVLRNLFDAIDYKYQNRASIREVQRSLEGFQWDKETLNTAERVFIEADANQDGILTIEELNALLSHYDRSLSLTGETEPGKGLQLLFGSVDEKQDKAATALNAIKSLQKPIIAYGNARVCEDGYFRSGEFCYKVIMNPICGTYDEARAYCVDQENADLPFLMQTSEWEALHSYLREEGLSGWSFWMRMRNINGTWSWMDVIHLQDAHWLSGQPDSRSTIASDCVHDTAPACAIGFLSENPGWVDESCDAKTKDIVTICQKRPERPNLPIGDHNYFYVGLTGSDLVGDFKLPNGKTLIGSKTESQISGITSSLSALSSAYIVNITRGQWNPSINPQITQTPFVNPLFTPASPLATSAPTAGGNFLSTLSSLANQAITAIPIVATGLTTPAPLGGNLLSTASSIAGELITAASTLLTTPAGVPSINLLSTASSLANLAITAIPTTMPFVKREASKGAVIQDQVPDGDCLANRVRNAQCAPQQGKRRRKRGCKDRRKRTLFLIPKIGWPQQPTITYAFEEKADVTVLTRHLARHANTKKIAEAAMKYWSDNTCVVFQEVPDDPMVLISRRKGCWSSIGRDLQQKPQSSLLKMLRDDASSNKVQILSLGPGCDKNWIALHEFGHLLGLDHEQARVDRDQFVMFQPQNVDPSMLFNFDICDDCCEKPQYTYDYGSIMHYKSEEFAKSKGLQTLLDKEGGKYENTMGNVWSPAFYDLVQINQALCKGNCAAKSSDCVNGGFMHPRNCGTCICPTGFGGKRCETFGPSIGQDCGGILAAKLEPQTFATPGYPIGGILKSPITSEQSCSWIIKAPAGHTVEVAVDNTTFCFPVDCRFGHVELKYKQDLATTGVRYCGKQGPPVIQSESELMVILLRIQEEIIKPPVIGFKISYRAVPSPDLAAAIVNSATHGYFDVAAPGLPEPIWRPFPAVASLNGRRL